MRLSLEVRSDNLSNLSFYARYAHTAYGEPSDAALAPSGDALAVASHSPFRFKGYLFDGETGLYYLNARYYDPSSGRFASPDGFAYLDPWALGFGPNPYAYCGCGPLTFSDLSGHSSVGTWIGYVLGMLTYRSTGQIGVTLFSYIGACLDSVFDEDVRKGMEAIKWNPFSYDSAAILDAVSNGATVSFFGGAPVFAGDYGGRSGSFGAIFLDRREKRLTALFHELGHVRQMMLLGPTEYAVTVFPASASELGVYAVNGRTNYYKKPWEASASMLGGDWGNGYNAADIIVSALYLLTIKAGGFAASYMFFFWGW